MAEPEDKGPGAAGPRQSVSLLCCHAAFFHLGWRSPHQAPPGVRSSALVAWEEPLLQAAGLCTGYRAEYRLQGRVQGAEPSTGCRAVHRAQSRVQAATGCRAVHRAQSRVQAAGLCTGHRAEYRLQGCAQGTEPSTGCYRLQGCAQGTEPSTGCYRLQGCAQGTEPSTGCYRLQGCAQGTEPSTGCYRLQGCAQGAEPCPGCRAEHRLQRCAQPRRAAVAPREVCPCARRGRCQGQGVPGQEPLPSRQVQAVGLRRAHGAASMTSPGTKASWLSQPTVKSVLVYRNGDPFFPGRRIVIHEKKVSNFDVFLKEVTGGVQAPFGAVRNIYTPRGGHRVRQLEELQSGEQYVAGGREAFKKLNYLDIGETKKKPVEVNNEVKPVTHSRITASARFRKPLQEPYTILLYTVDGKLVQNGSDLENGQIYVAVGREKFKKLPYGDLLSKSTTRRPQGSKTSVQPPTVGSQKSKGSGNDGQSKSTIGSSDQGENSSSPQLPKRKDKKTQKPENSVSGQHFSNHSTKVKQTVKASTGVLQDNDEDIYKARKEESEMWEAVEVQEDEDTLVEVPLDQRPAETVDEEENVEEENDRGEEAYKGEEKYPELNGEETVETDKETTEVEENKKKLNENYEDETRETQNVDQAEEKELIHLNGKNSEGNGEGMEHLNYQGDLQPEEEIKEDAGSQNQVDPGLENTSTNPRVTVTSPQESEKNDQSTDCAAVA
ncbi:doublecortin domain-containing protein 2 isoform X2 [Prinia subflava]|uniref:doublecortin domain-containing protein 2 isoform X2 n=1 Tax=Prinia subflava TaxID=208062 RepID=UPI002FE1045A